MHHPDLLDLHTPAAHGHILLLVILMVLMAVVVVVVAVFL
jgi:hypothetical protein